MASGSMQDRSMKWTHYWQCDKKSNVLIVRKSAGEQGKTWLEYLFKMDLLSP